MPAKSQSQQKLFGAVLGGADFPLAKKLRRQMTGKQIREFASTQRRGLPDHIKPPKIQSPQSAAKSFLRRPKTSLGQLYRALRAHKGYR